MSLRSERLADDAAPVRVEYGHKHHMNTSNAPLISRAKPEALMNAKRSKRLELDGLRGRGEFDPRRSACSDGRAAIASTAVARHAS